MTDSPTQSPHNNPTTYYGQNAAAFRGPIDFSAAASSSASTQFQQNSRSIESITRLSKRRLSGCAETGSGGDIEDSGDGFRSSRKRNRRVAESFLDRFRRERGLYVTDITSTEWCEKQMEYLLIFSEPRVTGTMKAGSSDHHTVLEEEEWYDREMDFFPHFGKPRVNGAMKVGKARHTVLQEEVAEIVEVHVYSLEDDWALKFLNFVIGIEQLLFEGLTRELPLLGFVEGVWMVGVVDEVQMPLIETESGPKLVETKTRVQATLPTEPQRRKGRLQLMCYKYLWDNLVANKFPTRKFFNFFSLNPQSILSKEIRENATKEGFPAKTLDDLVQYFQNTCSMLSPSHEQLLLRYEHQKDQSLLGEDDFAFDSAWIKGQIKSCLEFWRGERQATYTPEEERWKCKYCDFSSICPINTNQPRENQ